MKNTTSIQRITVALLFGYAFWEIGIWLWGKKLPPYDPIIRVDLVLISPILLVFIFISLYQYRKTKQSKKK